LERLTVLLAEDHAVVREGTREMLERDPGISVVGEAADGLSAATLAAELMPDVVLLDLGLPVLNGIETTKRIRALDAPPRVLILSAYDDEDYVFAAIEAGAGGYLPKTAHFSEVIAGLRAVAAGEVVLHPSVARKLLDGAGARRASHGLLTGSELQILRMASRGSHNKQIAAFLHVSPRTVEARFTSIFNKLGVSTRTEAIVHAASRGWLVLERRSPL
jgi:NarL family two-component system response regulator LiaR